MTSPESTDATVSRRVLLIAHNHASVRPGGVEQYTRELHRGFHEAGWQAYLLARTGPPHDLSPEGDSVTPFARLTMRDPSQTLVHTSAYGWDPFLGTLGDKRFLTRELPAYLVAIRPAVVHIQHTMFLGYDMVRAIRHALPDVAIVQTLHDYMPICHRDGVLVRATDGSRCDEESPRRCHQCFPEVPSGRFFQRKRFIQAQLAHVDRFIAPSRFLLERFVDWGIPRERIVLEELGRSLAPPVAEPEPHGRPRDRFGYFGQFNRFKGLDVLLEAVARQRRGADGSDSARDCEPRVRLRVHGANLELQPDEFRSTIRELLAETRAEVSLGGRYEMKDLPALMGKVDWVVVPSVWWENSPLVIQEAFRYGRPVIASGIGGLAEKVRDGVDGLLFRAGDPDDLLDVMTRAASTAGLWERLREGIQPPHDIQAHVAALAECYDSILMERAAMAAAP